MDELRATGRCPICRCEIPALILPADGDVAPPSPEAARQCLRCLTWYHQDCWDYGGGCGIFGCEPAAPARPCTPPRPAGPLWERVTRAGLSLALGTIVFLVGGVLGLVGWGAAGPLALPVILLLGWCSDQPDGQRSSSRMLRRGVLFGPLLFVVLPFPLLYLSLIPLGAAIAGLGQVLRSAGLYPRAFTGLAIALSGALSFSHAPEASPVPCAVEMPVPAWALARGELGTRPRLLQSADVPRAWRAALHMDGDRRYATPDTCAMCAEIARPRAAGGATLASRELLDRLLALPDTPSGCPIARRLPDDCRVLVMPRGGVEVEVSHGKDRLRVLTGASPWSALLEALTRHLHGPGYQRQSEPMALILPAGSVPVVVIERDLCGAVLGPRLDELLRAPGSPAACWGARPFWPGRQR